MGFCKLCRSFKYRFFLPFLRKKVIYNQILLGFLETMDINLLLSSEVMSIQSQGIIICHADLFLWEMLTILWK